MRPDIRIAVRFMIDTANDDSHGYDQTNRNGPDYDCSSLVGTALHQAGFNVSPFSWTGNLYKQLTSCDFVECTSPWKAGDVHLTPGKHVCMSIDSEQIAHARINELGKVTGGKTGDQTGNEIAVTPYYEPSYGWKYHLRYAPKENFTTNEIIAREVISGRWGNGAERRKRLEEEGHDYKAIQLIVNQLLNGNGKSEMEIAREIVKGFWGNGEERVERLSAIGYSETDIKRIQMYVNDIMKGE